MAVLTPTAFITGADRGLGLALAGRLLVKGWHVFAGQYLPDWKELEHLSARFPGELECVPLDVASLESVRAAAQQVDQSVGRLDLLINNAGVISQNIEATIGEPQDYAEIQRMYNVNALGPLRVVEAFLPLLDRGERKRLCFVSSEAGSINRTERSGWYGYCMSKAALNMGVRLLFNRLHPEGYTFRIYHPGWVRSYMSGSKNNAATLEPDEAALPAAAYFLADLGRDEDRLVLRDYRGREWPW